MLHLLADPGLYLIGITVNLRYYKANDSDQNCSVKDDESKYIPKKMV
jgi:hypothetical protein